jgi:FkbM family methyltransferase
MNNIIMLKKIQNAVDSLQSNYIHTLSSYINEISDKPIYIYGAGCFGKEIYHALLTHNVQPKGFLDQNAKEKQGLYDIPVCFPEMIESKSDVRVLIAIVLNKTMRKALENKLRTYGYNDIIDAQSIRAHYVYAENDSAEKDRYAYFSRILPQIKMVAGLWDDQESQETYTANLVAHMKRSYKECVQTDGEIQYFVKDIPFQKGFSKFIDCGGYIGDTLQELCNFTEYIDKVASFEPNQESFQYLSKKYHEELSEKIGEAVFFPCGIAGKTMMQHFHMLGGSSAIGGNGETTVQCVALDDVLKNFAPTFIKMDIEGAEYEALLGAEKMIKKYKPDLAISIYHIIDDFYRIPNLIYSWNLGYKFYLRTHSSCCMETIMYAVCPKEDE